MVTLALALMARGHTVTFLIYQKKIFYEEELEKAGIRVLLIDSTNKFSRFLKVRGIFWSHGQDLVLSYSVGPSFWAELSTLTLFRRRTWGLVASERGLERVMLIPRVDVLRRVHSLADHIFSNSYANCEQILSDAPWLKEKMSVIYNLIDASKFSRVKVPEPPYRNHIVIPARVAAVKNVVSVISAVAHIKEKLREAQGMIRWVGDSVETGDDAYVQRCQSLVEEEGLGDIFEFCPVTKHIEDEYKKCGAVGLFSIYEGLPNAVCEAMCCGKPIIATRVSDVPRLVTDNWNGFTCEASSVASIANALSVFLDTPDEIRASMAQHSYERAMEMFEFSGILDKMEALFEKVVRERRAEN